MSWKSEEPASIPLWVETRQCSPRALGPGPTPTVLAQRPRGQSAGLGCQWRWLMVPRPWRSRQPPPGWVCVGATLRPGGGAGSPPCVLGSGWVPRLPCRVTTVPCCLSTCPCSSAVPRAGRALCLHFPTSTSPSASATPTPHQLPLSQLSPFPGPRKAGDLEVRSWEPRRRRGGVSAFQACSLAAVGTRLNGVSLCSC